MNLKQMLSGGRTFELDGLRGWASLIVLLYHIFIEMLSRVVPELRTPLTFAVLNGQYAVFVFFVLSGDALSTPFFKDLNSRVIDRLAIKRYFRLTIPICISCFGVWMIVVLKADFHREASELLGNQEWLGSMLQIDASFYRLCKYVLYGVYASHVPQTSYNPFLWTMSFEIIGSFIVFLFCYSWRAMKNPFVALALSAVFLLALNSFYFLFLFGVMLSYARSKGWIAFLRNQKLAQLISLLVVPLMFVIVGWRGEGGIPWPFAMAMCAAFVVAVYVNNFYQRAFSSRVSLFLGRISFPLYLTHFWVLIFPMSWLVIHLDGAVGGGIKQAYMAVGGICFALSLVVAWAFERGERKSMQSLDRWLKIFVLRSVQ